MWGVALQNMSSQEDPAEMLGGPVAPVRVAVVCMCFISQPALMSAKGPHALPSVRLLISP